MKKLLNILSKPQVLILLSLGALFFSFGIVGNIVGGEGCGGGGDIESNGEYAEDDGGDGATSARIGGKFFAGETGVLDDATLKGFDPIVQEIIKGNQFIEMPDSVDVTDLVNTCFDLVHHLHQMNNKHLLATPLNIEGEKIAKRYGYRFVIPKPQCKNIALPKYVIFNQPLTQAELSKPVAYVGSKENYPDCVDSRYSDIKAKALSDAQLVAEIAIIREKIKNPETPSCSLELAIRSYCDGKGGALIKLRKGILVEKPWINSPELTGMGQSQDKALYSTMYLQKGCSGMVISGYEDGNAEVIFEGIDVTQHMPEGIETDKGPKDGNWYKANEELNVWIAKWSPLGTMDKVPTMTMDGKSTVDAATVVDDNHEPANRNDALLVTTHYDSSTKAYDEAAAPGVHAPNFVESKGPLVWHLRKTSPDVTYAHGGDTMSCKTQLGCQKGGGIEDFDKKADPRLKDGVCDYPDFYPYKYKKNADGTPVYGENGEHCIRLHERTDDDKLILRDNYYALVDEVAQALLDKPNLIVNHRDMTRIIKDTMFRIQFCQKIYSETTCKYGGFLILKLPAGDTPAKYKIELTYPGFDQKMMSSIVSEGKLFIRGVRLNMSVYGHSLLDSEYSLKLDGVELVRKHVVFPNGGRLIVDNSYFYETFMETLVTKDAGTRIFNTFIDRSTGKPLFGTNTLTASGEKKWGSKPYWEETRADVLGWGYVSFSFNTIYKGGGANGHHSGWLIGDNSWVNGGDQECIVEGDYAEGTTNFRAHQNWCINSGAGTALTFKNSSNIDIENNQFIHFKYEGVGNYKMKVLEKIYDKFTYGGTLIGISPGGKNINILNNLIVKSSPYSNKSIDIGVGENINVWHNTIASGNVAKEEKTMVLQELWQWYPGLNTYVFFKGPNSTYKDYTPPVGESPSKYTIKEGMKLPGSMRGIAVNKGDKDPFLPENHIILGANLAVDSVTPDYTNFFHPTEHGDYNETFVIPKAGYTRNPTEELTNNMG